MINGIFEYLLFGFGGVFVSLCCFCSNASCLKNKTQLFSKENNSLLSLSLLCLINSLSQTKQKKAAEQTKTTTKNK